MRSACAFLKTRPEDKTQRPSLSTIPLIARIRKGSPNVWRPQGRVRERLAGCATEGHTGSGFTDLRSDFIKVMGDSVGAELLRPLKGVVGATATRHTARSILLYGYFQL